MSCVPLRQWGLLATNVADPYSCIQDCRSRFVQKVAAVDDLQAICTALAANNTTLTEFYCCDSAQCGVSNFNRGQDPNVAWALSSCQGLGFNNLYDPGPPHDGNCPDDSLYRANETPCFSTLAASLTTSSTASMTAKITLPSGGIHALSIPGSIDSASSTFQNLLLSTSSTAPLTTATSATVTQTLAPSSTAAAASASGNSDEMPVAIRAIVAVCAVLALLTIAALFFVLCRRRRHRRLHPSSSASGKPPLLRSGTVSSPPSSPTRLITPPRPGSGPTSNGPLTPPLRLKDRQILPTPPRSMETGPCGQGTFIAHMNAADGFPTSPICAPTVNRLEPRREKMYRLDAATGPDTVAEPGISSFSDHHYRRSGAMLSAAAAKLKAKVKRDSANSATSTHGSAHSSPLSQHSHISPVRPPRPDTLLEIPGLLKPGPGSAKLHPRSASSPIIPRPPVPPMHPGRALSSSSNLPNRTRQAQTPAEREIQAAKQGLKGESRELCELTEEYAQQAKRRDADTVAYGGGPGIAITTSEETDIEARMLQEEDLEQMGGQYH